MNKKILSIDPGIVNLSYFYGDTTPNIIKWETLCVTENNCKKMKLEELIECMLITLNENFNENFEADIVLIENQPALLNGNMKTISVVIYTYFNMMRLQYGNIKEVQFISATNKLKCKKGIDLKTDTYKDRKKASIDIIKLYITDFFPTYSTWFNNMKKKDDASDCANQAIYYMEKILKVM
jgi:hypothetical protein